MPNPVAGFPDETTTGVPNGTNLTEYTGPMTITQDGTVIDGKTINGEIVVKAADVVIKNSVIQFDGAWGVSAENADNITVQNCRIVGPGTSGDSNSNILGSGNFINNDLSAAENGITLTNGSSTVTGNYIHDLEDGGSGPHYDGISVQGGQDGVLIQDNTIIARDNSNIFLKDDFGSINDVTINHNLLLGDPGYNVYVYSVQGDAVTNVSVTDNYVEEGYYGTYAVKNSSPDISGNVEFAQGEVPSGQTPDPTPSDPGTQPDPTPSDPGTQPDPTPSDPGTQPDPGSQPDPSQSGAVIDGTSGNDTLVGNATDNVIDGAAGKDTMTGGAGDNDFVFDKVADMGSGNNSDVITDFRQGHDTIDLSSVDANGAAAGNGSFHFQAEENAVFDKTPGALAYHFVDRAGTANDTTVIQGDVNGDGVHDFEIKLDGLVHLTADDFKLGSDSGSSGSGSSNPGSSGGGSQPDPTASDPGTSPDPTPTGGGSQHDAGGTLNVIDGTGGNDNLVGKSGDDFIDGGAGKDTMTGGGGDDVFAFDRVSDMGSANHSDVITDFQQGHDTIDLSSIDANGSAPGDASFHFQAKENDVFDKSPGALAYHFVDRAGTHQDTTVVQGDINGDGVHDFEINLHGLVHLTGDDFTL